MKSFLVGFVCLVSIVSAFGQQGTVKITGVFTQKKNYEVTIAGKTDEGPFRTAQYFVDTTTNQFSIVFPFRTGAAYEMKVAVMKMGHRRLEVDQIATFPLKLVAGQRMQVTLDPALFKQPGKGLKIGESPAKTAEVSVSGWLKGITTGSDLSFGKVVEGQLQTIQTCFIAKGDSAFSFSVPVEKAGFYYLSTVRNKKRLYLKPNDQINLVLDPKSGTELNASKSTEENRLIAQWEQLKAPLMPFVAMGAKPDREAFSAIYKNLQPNIEGFMQQIHTADAKFNTLFKSAIQLDNNLLALNMLLKSSLEKRGTFMMPSRDFLNVPDDYKSFLKAHRLRSANILQLGEGYEYLNLYSKFNLSYLSDEERKQLDNAGRVKLMMDATTNDTLKTFVLRSQLEELEEYVANYSEFKEVFMPYQRYAKSLPVKRKYDGLLNMFVADTAFIGKTAYDFVLPDVNGKMVSMEQFKGKVVLIDVWATWCGPCKAQMPFLKEVEHDYKGNDNVVFVGISLDAQKDKQKWLDMIKAKELEGVQLLDDVGKSFGRKYKAVSIPRFFLIDKAGKWAEVRCPLPENKDKLKKYIDREINRNI